MANLVNFYFNGLTILFKVESRFFETGGTKSTPGIIGETYRFFGYSENIGVQFSVGVQILEYANSIMTKRGQNRFFRSS